MSIFHPFPQRNPYFPPFNFPQVLAWLEVILDEGQPFPAHTSGVHAGGECGFRPDLALWETSTAPPRVGWLLLPPSQIPPRSFLTRADGKRGRKRIFLPALLLLARLFQVLLWSQRGPHQHTALSSPFGAQTKPGQLLWPCCHRHRRMFSTWLMNSTEEISKCVSKCFLHFPHVLQISGKGCLYLMCIGAVIWITVIHWIMCKYYSPYNKWMGNWVAIM